MEHDGGRELIHPVVSAVAAVGSALDGVGEVSVWSMTAEEQTRTLRDIARVEARLAEVKLRVVHQAQLDGTGATVGASSTATSTSRCVRRWRQGPWWSTRPRAGSPPSTTRSR